MATAHIEQLEEKLARYERVMSQCRRCKANLALEEVEDATPPAMPSPSAGSSQRTAPNAASALSSGKLKPTGRKGPSTGSSQQTASNVSSAASALSSKMPKPTGRQGPSTRSSKRDTSTSRPVPPPSSTEVVDPVPSMPPIAVPFGKTAASPSQDTVSQLSRSPKQTTIDAVPPLLGRSSTQHTFTAHSLGLRPTSLRPSTSSVDTLSADTNRPNTTGPSLSKSGSNVLRPQDDPHKQTGWLASADKMLGEVPLGWVWHANILQVDKSMLAAVTINTTAVPDDAIGAVDDVQNKEHLLRLVRGFAHRHSDKRVNFQQFLLVCLCKVLLAHKISQSSIVETLQICVSDTSERNIERYLRGAKWANEILDRLFFTGWRYRAIDLIVIWDRSIAMYGKIASSASYHSNIDYFVSHLKQSEYCKDVEEIPNRVHNTIPWIVKKEFGDEVSYETICKALGYSNDYILETKYLHSSTRSSSEADSSSLEDEDSGSERLSFHTARHSGNGVSSPLPTIMHPSGDLDGAAYLRAWSLLGNQLLPKDSHEDSVRRDPATDQIADLQRTKQPIPDRSAKPFGLSDIVPPRKPPSVDPNTGELLVSTSLGESAPATRNTKRPLPDSPTSQLQPDNGARRRQHEGDISSREKMGSSSRSGRKDSHKQRSRT